MRYFLLLIPLSLAAQNADSDQRLTQVLISEIQQLRAAIERSTLLSARTQLATSQMQLQEAAVVRLTAQLNETRALAPGTTKRLAQIAEWIKQAEQDRSNPPQSVEAKLRELKVELDQATTVETQRAAREGELAAQFQQAQSHMADSRSRIAEMERALDAAIQQMLKR